MNNGVWGYTNCKAVTRVLMNKPLAVILTNSYVNVDGKYPKRRLLLSEVFPRSSDFNVTVAGYVLRLPT